ncbi:MAG: hypothetical protein HKN77_02495 [Woeseiaceae bacterium]|nr:hypothetical protein [Woeseiaceae bacterium]
MTLNREIVFQFFKYAVYALLTVNIFIFGREEYFAAVLQFSDGLPVSDIIEAYAATIDTAAWVVLLLMFELETYVLDDRRFTPALTLTLHGIRIFCYAFILYAFYGYIANLLFVYDVSPLAIGSKLCSLVSEQWAYAVDLDEYVALSVENCAKIGSNTALSQFGSLTIAVDRPGLIDIQRLAWTDVINAGVWILVVIILEIDVRLQERKRLDGLILKSSNAIKFVLYSILMLAAIYWGIKGDFVDFWDAFLWLLAFFFIELNVIEWRQETAGETS